MRLAPLVLGSALLAVSGCSFPQRSTPLPGTVNLVLDDERPYFRDETRPFMGGWITYIPLLPANVTTRAGFSQRSLLPELRRGLEDAKLFESMLGPGDSFAERAATDYELRVAVRSSGRTTVASGYGLSLVGLVLHALGAPYEYEYTWVELEVTCRDREGNVLATGTERKREFALCWIYEDSMAQERQDAVDHCVRTALYDTLEPLFD